MNRIEGPGAVASNNQRVPPAGRFGPARNRSVHSRRCAWKSVGWIETIEFRGKVQAGFWKRRGYHMHGGPWKEERFG